MAARGRRGAVGKDVAAGAKGFTQNLFSPKGIFFRPWIVLEAGPPRAAETERERGMADGGGALDIERLMGEMRPRLHRYCARMMGSAFEGEDVVQDALAKAATADFGRIDRHTPG